jgi:GNAT superfamily N-acetyltransferase
MINLGLLSIINMDALLSSEAILYHEIKSNDALCTSTKLKVQLLRYSQNTLGIAVEISKAFGTENGRVVLQMLTKNLQDLEGQIRRVQSLHTSNPVGLEHLLMLKELPCCHTVLNLVCVHRSRLLRAYGQARKIKAPETCIFKFGKLLAEMGEACLVISNAVLELSGCFHFRVGGDRLFRMDFLTDSEFERTGLTVAKAGNAKRLEILARLRLSGQFSWEHLHLLDTGVVFVALSPWDQTHCLGYLILSRDILDTREQFEAVSKQAMKAEVENSGREWMDSLYIPDPMLYLDYIEVSVEAQGCGIGTRMIKWAAKMAESKGVKEIALGGDKGAESWPFWQKLGFEPCQSHDCVSMIISAA